MDIARASIKRSTIVLFICVLLAIQGVSAYNSIGKLEDPAFTIKTAIVAASYPGSTAEEAAEHVASKLEDAVQTMGQVDKIRTRCSPGGVSLNIDIKASYTKEDLPAIWNILRQKISDVQGSLPSGCSVYINNDFGDVFGQYYALAGDGFTMNELYDYAKFLKQELVLIPSVAKVSIVGEQTDAIYVEFSSSRLMSLGLSPSSIFSVLNAQSTISSLGKTYYGSQYVTLRPSGEILTEQDIGDTVISPGGGRLIRLREVAQIKRAPLDPQSMMIFYNGRPALGIGISTIEGGNVVTMGEAVAARLEELEKDCPLGMELGEIYMQSKGVVSSVHDFVINLIESIVIVVGVLLVFMGLRSGLMIGLVLLLTVAGTLIVMDYYGIFLQQVSLAALIIALGSLVDNAIVVAEGMLIGVQGGRSAEDAASDTVNGSIWAMLGGTLIAVLAFAPIGMSPDNTGEYCRSLLQIVGISMILSWLFAITATPVLGKLMLKPGHTEGDPYGGFIFRAYRAFLEACLHHRLLTVIVVVFMFVFSVLGFTKIDKTFFPSSTAKYFVADIWSREGTSLNSQLEVAKGLEARLLANPAVKNVSTFVGQGGLRFMLTYSPPSATTALSEFIVEMTDDSNPQEVLLETQRIIDEEMPGVEGVCKLFSKGSGMAPVIEARFYGPDPDVLRNLAAQAREIMERDPIHNCVRIDWRNRVMTFLPEVRKDRMQTYGITRPQINSAIMTAGTGYTAGIFRDGDRTLPIVLSLAPEERNHLENLRDVPIWAPLAGRSVTLGTIMSGLTASYEDNVIMRRNRKLVITALSDVKLGTTPSIMQERIRADVENIELPDGYTFEWGGEEEGKAKAMNGMSSMFMPCLVAMFMIMVFLFNGFRQPVIIFASIPLIIIGVVLGLMLGNLPLSFMAIIGVLSLVGMLAKNSIVLLDQVASDFASGKDRYEAIVETGVSRLRPVAMSAVTTVLGMIPLLWDNMFNSMAAAIMGGLTVSTILTMIFIPVVTAMAYGVKNPGDYDYDDDDED